jgi:hypothetical protein
MPPATTGHPDHELEAIRDRRAAFFLGLPFAGLGEFTRPLNRQGAAYLALGKRLTSG